MPKRVDDPFPDESHAPGPPTLLIEPRSIRLPAHLLPILRAIARRQRTTVEVVVAQAVSDYCHRGV